MDEKSVNVESRTSSQDKRWTIMAALLGTNTAFMLFQGIEQERTYTAVREVALTFIAVALPFQGIYFLIYTYILEHEGKLTEAHMQRLRSASAVCQIVAYGSLIGVALMWYNISTYVGIFFVLSSGLAVILIRTAIRPLDQLEAEEAPK
ncbi:MAG: hypothetical protein QNL85_04590 [Euryarchaeota archaeon]|tara:strand:- start:971 stop:1417 length:447 start_codon:yes stop_codon:yes gene_type:complete